MMPWEREVFLTLLKNYIDEENEKVKQRNNKYG